MQWVTFESIIVAFIAASVGIIGSTLSYRSANKDSRKKHELELNDKYYREIQDQDAEIKSLKKEFADMRKEFAEVKKNHEKEVNYYKVEIDKKDDIIDELEHEKQVLVTQNQNYKQEIDTLKSRVDRLEKPDGKEET